MVVEAKEEKIMEEQDFEAFQQFCENVKKKEEKAIKEGDEKIAALKGSILGYETQAQERAEEIAELDAQITDAQGDLKTLTRVREQGLADFAKQNTEYNEEISALAKVLANEVVMGLPSAKDKLMETNAQLKNQQKALQEEEAMAQNEFDARSRELKVTIGQAQDARADKSLMRKKALESLAHAKGDLASTTATRDGDASYLEALTAECEQSSVNFAKTQQKRAEEIESLEQAAAVRCSPPARRLDGSQRTGRRLGCSMIEKVIKMLDGQLQTIHKDLDAERQASNEYFAFCSDQQIEKGYAIKTGKEKIEMLLLKTEDQKHQLAVLSAAIADDRHSIKALGSAQVAGIDNREKKLADFKALNEESNEQIALVEAVVKSCYDEGCHPELLAFRAMVQKSAEDNEKGEQEARVELEAFKAEMNMEIDQKKESLSDNEKKKALLEEEHQEAFNELQETQGILRTDTLYLAGTNAECEEAAASWEHRQEMAQQEIESIAKAKEILASRVAV
eukprot:gnl/MRDRNA2_/MRDRNA2_85129_c0_seq2.p1 gnl/MRDRNA2_/MRDRNA2_85129_c0~~gnl/MRDRNA2_/MRDRNA2_85129_c0_seq2.p1  ORF type:complete len:508 (-),score=168.67 gnl/MRDRNA2_/MRDRNA2_85129_c0_seq2:153-1676(-)